MDHIKFIAVVAEQNGRLNYYVTNEMVAEKMYKKYGIIWQPRYNELKAEASEKKEPIHRHKVWEIL